jgi:2-oxoacid:acceptor oxidoreductase gamma subunit (pyruvate/2-ketoisovalerate family)/2-oxoacid:acceptor oxidoreductase delta subunit (pyruvate/2-ketoisovalerate family)
MVTAFEILAKIFSKLGDYQVQAFPAFGVERTGAPVQAFLRVAKKEIYNRSNIYQPHFVVVFDESLIDQVPVFDGLKPNGAVLLNTIKSAADYASVGKEIYTVPATQIAIQHGVGTKALPIVNAAMIGAMLRIFDADIAVAEQIIKSSVPSKPDANAATAHAAYDGVIGEAFPHAYLKKMLEEPHEEAVNHKEFKVTPEYVEPDFVSPYWSLPLSKNKTGNWRLFKPEHATRVPPCNKNCPAGTDVREFVKLAGERRFDDAAALLERHNPFPSACGRVCPHFCEQNCNRNSVDGSLNIGAIERFLGDRMLSKKVSPVPLRFDERIAVIGAGPAGLTAGLRLREKGYAVDVYEALPYAGGMMRTGIPKFRLPDEVLNAEIALIEQKGVNIHCDRKVTVEELSPKYAAIVASVGSHVGTPLDLENDHLVTEGISFLRQFKLMLHKGGIKKGDIIAIIGGGNTAIDVARTTLRLGGIPIVYYRRTMREMPAIALEVEEAMAEGVQFEFLVAPTAVKKNGHGKIELTLQRMELGEPDASGRRKPVPIQGSETKLIVDKVIAAIGQRFDDFAFGSKQVKPQQGNFMMHGSTPVFGAGDMAWGGTVTEAIGSGNKVAEEVHAHLRGLPYHPKETMPEVVLPEELNLNYYLPVPRHNGKVHQPKDLYMDFEEVNSGLAELDIKDESDRCLHCGECFSCGNCFNFCPDAAITVDDAGRLRIDYDYCKGCGICVQECPCSAITYEMI